MPAANRERWEAKFTANARRDSRVRRLLRKLGWDVLVIWECQLAADLRERLVERIRRFLG